MHRCSFLLGIAAWLVASYATAAEIRARYALPTIGATMTVEVDDHGNSRISVNGESALITVNGVAYAIVTDTQGSYAVRQDDMLAAFNELARGMIGAGDNDLPEPDLSDGPALTDSGLETVGGRTGTRWVFGHPPPDGEPPSEVVISADSDLAPVGQVLSRQFQSSTWSQGFSVGPLGLRGEVPPEVLALIARGTIIRFGTAARLEGVEAGPVSDSLFTLPSAILTRAEFETRLRVELTRPN